MIDKSGKGEQPSGQPHATNQQIQKWVARKHGFVPETAWIDHCKELFGIKYGALTVGAPDNPCPPEHQPAIRQAFAHFGMLPKN
jgi:hypothetical protein